MNIKIRLAEEVIEILGEDADIDGCTVRGVFDLEEKNDFGEHLTNPRASFYILAKEKSKPKKRLKYKEIEYEITSFCEEQEGIERLELRRVREKTLETILPRN